MTLRRYLFLATAIVEWLAGVGFLLAPAVPANLYGVVLGDGGILVTRLLGGALIVIGTLCWVAPREMQTGLSLTLAFGVLFYHLVATVATALGIGSGTITSGLAWAIGAVHGVLFLGFLVSLTSVRE